MEAKKTSNFAIISLGKSWKRVEKVVVRFQVQHCRLSLSILCNYNFQPTLLKVHCCLVHCCLKVKLVIIQRFNTVILIDLQCLRKLLLRRHNVRNPRVANSRRHSKVLGLFEFFLNCFSPSLVNMIQTLQSSLLYELHSRVHCYMSYYITVIQW